MKTAPATTSPPRLAALDAFRGLTMAAMVVVNNPGSWSHVHPPLRHAEWHGCTPTDLIFPFFLFIVGTAMAFSKGGRADARAWARMGRRVAVLFALGLLLNASSMLVTRQYGLTSLRIPGVLQRIAVCYALAFAITRCFSLWGQAALALSLVMGHTALLLWTAAPGFPKGTLTPEGHVGAWIDQAALGPAHLYRGGPYDPEGLLGTMTATVTVLVGFWAGLLLRDARSRPRAAVQLAAIGAAAALAGWLWGRSGLPINKPLWTGSYVVFTGGWAMVFLAACVLIGESARGRRVLRPWEVLGCNAILLFVGSGLLARVLGAIRVNSGGASTTLWGWFYHHLAAPIAGPVNGSLLQALMMLVVWWVLLYALWRRRWFLKV